MQIAFIARPKEKHSAHMYLADTDSDWIARANVRISHAVCTRCQRQFAIT